MVGDVRCGSAQSIVLGGTVQVWMQLEEKRIPYEMEKVNMRCYGDKKPSFLKLAPSGLLPVVEYNGRIITESATIASLLEREFPENPLLPDEGTLELKRAEALMRCWKNFCSMGLFYIVCDALASQRLLKIQDEGYITFVVVQARATVLFSMVDVALQWLE